MLSAAASLLLNSGCSPPPRTVEVVGRVTYHGTPVEGAVVVFFAEEFSDDLPAAGGTDATGHYALRTYFSAHDMALGAIPNDYVVSVQKWKLPNTFRAQERMKEVAAQGGDTKRYIAEEAVHDLWPEGVPDGWPDGYVPTINRLPDHVFNDKKWLAKVTLLERGVPLLPVRYADPATSGFRATVERTDDGPLIFNFDLTDEPLEDAVAGDAAGGASLPPAGIHQTVDRPPVDKLTEIHEPQ